jgi:hypothetical protein
LRTLYGKPALIKPPLGRVPALPPLYVASVAAASSPADDLTETAQLGEVNPARDQQLLKRRVSQIDETLEASHEVPAAVDPYQHDALTRERQILEATLTALRGCPARRGTSRRRSRCDGQAVATIAASSVGDSVTA